MKSTLIISTYNWPEALELVLKSVLKQTVLTNEVIIADDGSDNRTKRIIENFKTQFKTPLIHVWHEDSGFRKAMILNKAISRASGEYIIQVDGDCILHKNFIKDHIRNCEVNFYLYGSRVNIQKKYLEKLFKNQKINFTPLSKGIKKRGRAIYSNILSCLQKPEFSISKKYRGCNTSYFKKDIIDINGYDEDFTGWGREDSELAIRLHNNDILSKRLKHCAIVYHIWHNVKSKDQLQKNNDIENTTIKENRIVCSNGINKYLKSVS